MDLFLYQDKSATQFMNDNVYTNEHAYTYERNSWCPRCGVKYGTECRFGNRFLCISVFNHLSLKDFLYDKTPLPDYLYKNKSKQRIHRGYRDSLFGKK